MHTLSGRRNECSDNHNALVFKPIKLVLDDEHKRHVVGCLQICVERLRRPDLFPKAVSTSIELPGMIMLFIVLSDTNGARLHRERERVVYWYSIQ